ncbi:HNH endonuclease signature motif containing protein [Cellulomonas rhizosphaerae]|uniref:HNH endonuclease n=1 Tax=Cellulomonas rhizosphaerae TaxID=2293719 RepID=A0A413RKW2_9CELL|nr:HNH endonuclease signature motif containing protein [Cellulomonas rhizosphaerae]RHA40122.1 HNH endonuclease [Cellulomonas rhizosphaerae]
MAISSDDLLEAMRVATDLLAEFDPRDLDGCEAAQQFLALDQVAGRITALAARRLPVVEADGWWATDGSRTVASWVSSAGRMTYGRAASLVRLGRAFQGALPLTAAAASAGTVPFDHAQALARHAPTSDIRKEALAAPASECGEEFLVEHAEQLGADPFARLVARWAAAADPESDERGYRKATDREFVGLSETTGGFHLKGFLTTNHGATLRAALDAVMTPPTPDDTRTTQQRRAQALADVARLTLDQGLVGSGAAVRPHLTCIVDWESLQRALHRTGAAGSSASGPFGFRLEPIADEERFAVGEIPGAGPIPQHVLARLACDSEITRVVFGPQSQVINVGRAERTFSGPRRRAIIARDGTCRYPDCSAPPSLGELHHVDHWVRDLGDTDANRGILLCWYHHALVHRLGIEIGRSPTGRWTFTTRYGSDLARAA